MRPQLPLIGNASLFWRAAAVAVVQGKRPREGIAASQRARSSRKRYYALFVTTLLRADDADDLDSAFAARAHLR